MSVLNTAYLTSKISSESGEEIEVSSTSNNYKTTNVSSDIAIIRESERSWVVPEGKVIVTTTITNNSDIDVTDIRLTDTISDGGRFNSGSLKIGSQTYDELDPTEGINLPITIGGFGVDASISYEIVLDKYVDADVLTSSSTINFSLDGSSFSLNSNEVIINILKSGIVLLKSASANVVKLGDELTYTIEISNTGNLINTELFFRDPIPTNTSFVQKSVAIDGVLKEDLDPETGFNLKDLNPGDSVTVSFKVTVN